MGYGMRPLRPLFGSHRGIPIPILLVVCGVILALRPFTSPAAEASPKRLRLLTSFLPVHSIASTIAGDRAEVENWLPRGVDPHEFQFAPRDLKRLANADILFVLGLGLEGWSEAHLRSISGNPALRVVELARGIPPQQLLTEEGAHEHAAEPDHDHDHGTDHPPKEGVGNRAQPNPHIWLDPLLMLGMVQSLSNSLVQSDPAQAGYYSARAAGLARRLEDLHLKYDSTLGPARSTAFITLHNAFPYLARRYQLRLVGVVETTAAEEPSAQELAELTRTVRKEQARVIFTDGRPSRMAARLAKDLRLVPAALETLETGDFGAEAYEAGMLRNLEVLRRTLVLAPPATTKAAP